LGKGIGVVKATIGRFNRGYTKKGRRGGGGREREGGVGSKEKGVWSMGKVYFPPPDHLKKEKRKKNDKKRRREGKGPQ